MQKKISVLQSSFITGMHDDAVSFLLLCRWAMVEAYVRPQQFAGVVAVGFAVTRIIHRGKSCFLS